MPVIGRPRPPTTRSSSRSSANAKAAIDKAVELGVTDPERVGVIGHSHGALMTANLLAHSDLFRAGIARSGAYNHTLRPFGFQSERRTLWQARDTYIKLSPVMHADKLNEPLLLIHGEIDQNPGTVPLQSEKLYEAVRGDRRDGAPGHAALRRATATPRGSRSSTSSTRCWPGSTGM